MMQQDLNLDAFRTQLQDMRATLQQEITSLDSETQNTDQTEGYGVKNHPAEDATELFTRQRNMAVEAQMQRELDQIEHALERIDAGTYGVCEECGKPIPAERLEARPAATMCIEHQRVHDEQTP